jgi:hypothetical protein
MISRRSLLAGMAGASFMARSPKANAAETFGLYDSLLFTGKPDLSPYGFKRARTVYQSELWPPKADYTTPNEAAVRSKAGAVLAEGVTAAMPVMLDVEQYSVDVRLDPSHINPNTSTVDANIRKLEQIIGWFKDQAPTLKVGFYDIAPITGFPVSGHHPTNDTELAIWEMANSYVIPFVTHVDALYPSLYTFDTDPAKWVALARRYISAAKRIGSGKPVRPFIWPQYHDVMRGPLAGTYINYDYWMLQLTTIRDAGASGIIFWGGYRTQWDDTQDWWHATLDFIASI